jgi:acetoin utilization deacetylase AcuC-like enzyme
LILHNPSSDISFHDFGIMIPISPYKKKRILDFIEKDAPAAARGASLPYPGPVLGIPEALSHLKISGDAVLTREDLERAHSREYIASLYDKSPRGKLEAALHTTYELFDAQGRPNRYEPGEAKKPLTGIFDLVLALAGGSWLACRLALAYGFCYYLGGGMHHGRYDSGSGFCLINDIAIATFKLLAEAKPPRLIWIIDLDAHKGDGTAELIRFARKRGELHDPERPTADDSDAGRKPCILSLSIHMAKGWPLDKDNIAAAQEGRAPLLPSDIDIGIDSGEEGEYTSRLVQGFGELEGLSAALGKPDLVLVVAGADPYEHDELPSSHLLKLSLEQCLERDNYVYRYCKDRSIPSAWILSGGYGERAWEPPAHFLRGIRA